MWMGLILHTSRDSTLSLAIVPVAYGSIELEAAPIKRTPLGDKAKTLPLLKSCRSVRPTPRIPWADREARLTGTRPEARFLHHRATPSSRPWSG